jgi:ABC-2 type transport system ATP-binding protein
MTPALSISHLTKRYRRGTLAVDDLSLEVKPGDFFGFLGPNGAGKSTTINCITGIASPTSGTIEVFGVDTVKRYRDARRLVGMCPQEFNVDTFAKVYERPNDMRGSTCSSRNSISWHTPENSFAISPAASSAA